MTTFLEGVPIYNRLLHLKKSIWHQNQSTLPYNFAFVWHLNQARYLRQESYFLEK